MTGLATEEGHQVFLCYTRADSKNVQALYYWLREKGFRSWMDTEDLLAGEKWLTIISREIRRSQFFLACVSKSWENRGEVMIRELRIALDARELLLDDDIYLIPVRLEECDMPEILRGYQWVDLFDKRGWAKLLGSLKVGLERMGKQPPLTAPRADQVHVEIDMPDGRYYETVVSSNVLIGRLQRGLLEDWRPVARSFNKPQRFSLCDANAQRFDPTLTLAEAGLRGDIRLMLLSDELGTESPVYLTVEDGEGELYTTQVPLHTPVHVLAEAFLGHRHDQKETMVAEAALGPPDDREYRRLSMDRSLYEERVGDQSMVRIRWQ